MNDIWRFKDLMHEPMLLDREGSSSKLAEIIGEDNVERLRNLGVIRVLNGKFLVTEVGEGIIKLYNRQK